MIVPSTVSPRGNDAVSSSTYRGATLLIVCPNTKRFARLFLSPYLRAPDASNLPKLRVKSGGLSTTTGSCHVRIRPCLAQTENSLRTITWSSESKVRRPTCGVMARRERCGASCGSALPCICDSGSAGRGEFTCQARPGHWLGVVRHARWCPRSVRAKRNEKRKTYPPGGDNQPNGHDSLPSIRQGASGRLSTLPGRFLPRKGAI